MGRNLVINENQLEVIVDNLLLERLGVPEHILDSAEVLYDAVSNILKGLEYKNNNYRFEEDINLPISDISIDNLILLIDAREMDDHDGKAEVASMGVSNKYEFDNKVLMKIIQSDQTLELLIRYVVSNDWDVSELYDTFTKDKSDMTSVLAHELKHKYDKEKKTTDLIGRDAEYQIYSRGELQFGIPVINQFMRFSYFIQHVENMVRPTEIASRMRSLNITKDTFMDFIKKDKVYMELIEIKNFTYEKLIQQLNEQMGRVDGLLNHVEMDIDDITSEEKINEIFELVYVNLANGKVEHFDRMISTDNNNSLLGRLFGMVFPDNNEEKEKVRNKFINHVSKYKNRETEFFVDECERFNYVATKMIKKIGKLYDMAKDNEEINESIIDWDLHQRLMEKEHGKTKFKTKFDFKK